MPAPRFITLLAVSLLLAGCGPSLEAERIAGHTVMITNQSEERVTIRRIVANKAGGRAECVDAPGALLGPGRSYTTTFFYCGEVREIAVETDRGTRSLDFD